MSDELLDSELQQMSVECFSLWLIANCIIVSVV
jgi:hypothetical protein